MPDTLEVVTRVNEDNKRIVKKIRQYFVAFFDAHKLQTEIQAMEDSMKILELKVGGIEFFAMYVVGRNQPGFINDMKEQLRDNHDSLAHERDSIVTDLDFNIRQLDFARTGLESDTPELIALNVAIEKLGGFAWAFKDSRADMMDLFAVPDVLKIFNEKAAEVSAQVEKV